MKKFLVAFALAAVAVGCGDSGSNGGGGVGGAAGEGGAGGMAGSGGVGGTAGQGGIGGTVPVPVCGDGVIEGDEVCDDNNTDAGDGCGPNCLVDMLNGSFETADYTDWTLLEDSGAATNGAWAIVTHGDTIPGDTTLFDFFDEVDVSTECLTITAPVTVAATEGTSAAMQIQTNPENHRMYQDVALSLGTTMLAWDMAYQNAATFDPDNQYIAVHIRNPDDDAILATVFETTQGVDPQVLAMSPFAVDISAYAGQTVRIDVEHQVQSDCFDAVYDNFRVF